jgi:hypothetical protein
VRVFIRNDKKRSSKNKIYIAPKKGKLPSIKEDSALDLRVNLIHSNGQNSGGVVPDRKRESVREKLKESNPSKEIKPVSDNILKDKSRKNKEGTCVSLWVWPSNKITLTHGGASRSFIIKINNVDS